MSTPPALVTATPLLEHLPAGARVAPPAPAAHALVAAQSPFVVDLAWRLLGIVVCLAGADVHPRVRRRVVVPARGSINTIAGAHPI